MFFIIQQLNTLLGVQPDNKLLHIDLCKARAVKNHFKHKTHIRRKSTSMWVFRVRHVLFIRYVHSNIFLASHNESKSGGQERPSDDSKN